MTLRHPVYDITQSFTTHFEGAMATAMAGHKFTWLDITTLRGYDIRTFRHYALTTLRHGDDGLESSDVSDVDHLKRDRASRASRDTVPW